MLILTGLGMLPMLLIYVLIAVIVLSAVYWLINKFAPEPIRGYAIAVVVILAVIFLIYFLLQMVGSMPSR